MTADRRDRIDQAIVAALESAPAEREAAIARVCGTDDALRTEVRSLIAAAEASQGFLEGSALDRLAQEVAADGWRLQPGERVGPYTVDRLLGSGGSGEVWRARDERLQRDVAIKVLLPDVSRDPDRLRRFTEEARSASALNHPNILSVYDVGDHRGTAFLVTECVEGRSLRERLEAGPLPVSEALVIALQIANGLAAAHARGIVHRDLKPDNLRLRADRVVKIVDFGLARLQVPTGAGSTDAPLTITGVIAGTPGYMAPEQVRGEPVDGRADLFALGATLYEMLGGRRPFAGTSTIEILHGILATDPPDIAEVVPDLPPAVGAIVMRLLQKERDARFQSATDVAWALEQAMQRTPAAATRGRKAMRPSVSPAAWTLAGTAAALTIAMLAAGALWVGRRDGTVPAVSPLTPFAWSLPEGLVLDSPPVPSPDGRRIVFAATGAGGRRQLWLKEMAWLPGHAVAIPGTDAAVQPFWKPDSRSVGFFARGMLMKVALDGGAPVELAPATDPRGGAWSASGTIVFTPDLIGSGLVRVSENSGPVAPVTLLDLARGENSHRWPVFLPDGIHVVYFVRAWQDDRRGVYLARIDRAAAVPGGPIFRSESEVVWVPPVAPGRPGDLLSVHDGRIEARPFDAVRLVPAGDPRSIDLTAGSATPYHAAMLGVSAEVMAFASSPMPFGFRLGSVDLRGGDVHLRTEREILNWPRVSPDGLLLARALVDPVRGTADIWVEDLATGRRVRVTTAPLPDNMPVWGPGSDRLAYVSGLPPGRPGPRALRIAAADGTGVIGELRCPEDAYCEPTDWTPDGTDLIVTVRHVLDSDVWRVPVDGSRPAERVLAERFNEGDARISPNGLWIAYVSDDHGRSEVFVRSLSGPPFRTSISAEGGSQPVWSRDGARLYFVDPGGRLRAVPVLRAGDGPPRFGAAEDLPVPLVGSGHWGTQYDVTREGRLYFVDRDQDRPAEAMTVVPGWRGLLDSRAAVRDRRSLR